MVHKIYVCEVKAGVRGMLYNAEYDGEVICRSTLTPFLDACRVLQSRGMSGAAEMWDRTRQFPRMRGAIESTSKIVVREGDFLPRFAKYGPFDRDFSREGEE